MELTTVWNNLDLKLPLFMMSKIQNLNGTHNNLSPKTKELLVVYDVKDTKFEWNSQRNLTCIKLMYVVYDVKDTKSEYNVQNTELYHTLK